VQEPHTQVASRRQITKPPIRKIDNLYEKRTNPLARLFTTPRSLESSNLFLPSGVGRKAERILEWERNIGTVNIINLRSRTSRMMQAKEWRHAKRKENGIAVIAITLNSLRPVQNAERS
jgi:hypothetical protein